MNDKTISELKEYFKNDDPDVVNGVIEIVKRAEAEQGEGWLPMAKQYADGMEYYRGLVVKIGEMLGEDSYIADDGSKSQDVLCAKIPEIVEKRIHPTPAKQEDGLVEALEKLARLGNGSEYGNSDGNRIAQDALAKYKGAK